MHHALDHFSTTACNLKFTSMVTRTPRVFTHRMTSWRTSLALLGFVVLGAGCVTTTSSTPTTPDSSSTATTTTTPIQLVPASGEKEVACDAKAISASYGEKVKVEKCTETWAVGDTDRDSWNCEDEGCRQTRLYRFANNKWSDTAICLRELPLTRYASSCFVPNVGLATIDLIPPQDVACILWPTNSQPKYVKETQCVFDESEVLKSFDTKCEGFFEKTTLPLEKCHQGALVQQALVKLQQLKYVRNVDIYFGPEMARAVFEFQTDNNLLRTGILDDETWKALNP